MSQAVVARTVIDSVRFVVILDGQEVTILSDLSGTLGEVAKGSWDGAFLTYQAWLGRDEEHDLMVRAALQRAVVRAARNIDKQPTLRT